MAFDQIKIISPPPKLGLYYLSEIKHLSYKPKFHFFDQNVESNFVGSMVQESSEQLKLWFSEHFFAPKLAGLFVTPIVSATSNKFGAKKCLKNHIPFDF